MSTLQKHLNSVSERFDEKFEGFYDLIPTEDNGYTSSEITHYEELKSFLLQENKRVIELVVEELRELFGECDSYDPDCIVCKTNDLISKFNLILHPDHEPYKDPCVENCIRHPYHCAKCNTAAYYSPANNASRPFDIPSPCNRCLPQQ